MARSYKKHSYLGMKKNRYYKRLVHTKNRMLERCNIFLSSRMYKLQVNPWEICDYGHTISKYDEWYERGRRK